MKLKLEFKTWLERVTPSTLETEIVDSKSIESIYKKAKNAVELVRRYDAAQGEHGWIKTILGIRGTKPFGYLRNISMIAPLSGNNYGLFNSSETERFIDANIVKDNKQGPPQSSQPVTFKPVTELSPDEIQKRDFLKQMALDVITQKFPNIDLSGIHSSAAIHVNVQNIVGDIKKQFGKVTDPAKLLEIDKAIIKQIASTIVHESTHELEYKKKAKSTEVLPEQAQQRFEAWVDNNPAILDSVSKAAL